MAKAKICMKVGKITVFLILFLVIVTIFFNYFSYSVAREKLIEGYIDMVSIELKEKSYLLRKMIDDPMKALASRSQLSRNGDNFREYLNTSMRIYIASRHGLVKEVTYLNKDGISELVLPHSEEKLNVNYADELFFKEIKEGKTHLTKDIDIDGRKEIIISVPLLIQQGNDDYNSFNGVLFARLDTGNIFDIALGQVNSRRTPEYAVVLDSDGTALYHLNEDFVGKNYKEVIDEEKYPEMRQAVNRSLQGEEGYGEYTFYSHKKGVYANQTEIRKLVVYMPMQTDGIKWSIWTVIPMKELENLSGLGQLKTLLYFNAFMVLLLFVIIASYFFLLCRRMRY